MEAFQSMSDAPLKTCPACKKKKLVRLIGSGAGIIFKGSGFYETDYKRKASPASAEKSTPAAPAAAAPATTTPAPSAANAS